ncbi:MAG: hypothetical protein NTZ05_10380 [Chloroflexi bacterium]|nr:hypothetical protein [Chloroflexota bacterium]
MRSPEQWMSVGYGTLGGFAASTLISVVPLFYAQGLSAWVLPTYAVSAVSATVLAMILVRLERKIAQGQGVDISIIMRDMDEMEQMDEGE